jgi:fluoride exporter
MHAFLLVGTGSFIGGILRYVISLSAQNRMLSTFPFGTFTVNVIGCFLIGIILGAGEKINLSPDTRLFLATGICGGFTTFSAFSQETFSLLRDGQVAYAVLYILASVVIGLLATIAGVSVLKLV